MAQNVTLKGRQGFGSVNVGLDFKLACNPSNAEIPQPQFFDSQVRIPQRLFEPKPLLILVFAQGQSVPPIRCRLSGWKKAIPLKSHVKASGPAAILSGAAAWLRPRQSRT